MAISFVGSQTSDASAVNDLVVLLPAGLQQGDLVVVIGVQRNTTNDLWSEGSGTWTKDADLFSSDSRVSNFAAFHKVMGATPDSSVTISQDGSAAGMCGVASAYRGVDQTTPLDAAVTTATGINSSEANPPSITTVTDNAWVVACGGSSTGASPTLGAPTGYSNATMVKAANTNACLYIASKAITPAGAEDPGNFTNSTTGASDSWEACSFALRPAATDSGVLAASGSGALSTTGASDAAASASAAGVGSASFSGVSDAEALLAASGVGATAFVGTGSVGETGSVAELVGLADMLMLGASEAEAVLDVDGVGALAAIAPLAFVKESGVAGGWVKEAPL